MCVGGSKCLLDQWFPNFASQVPLQFTDKSPKLEFGPLLYFSIRIDFTDKVEDFIEVLSYALYCILEFLRSISMLLQYETLEELVT